MNTVRLGNTLVGRNTPPYVIAEIGVNHEGSIEQALRLVREARDGGCHAAKFQTYKAEKLASRHSPAYWDISQESTGSQFALFSKYDRFGPDEYRRIAAYCSEIGIDFLSTPFDDEALDFLDPLVPFFKIASADLTNVPFLRKVAAKQKTVVLSTGASTMGEIDEALAELQTHGCPDVVLLHCVLNYPTHNADAHLGMIRGLSRAYPDVLVGYSDHTLPDEFMTSLLSAYLLGARVLEKHFTHDKSLPGNDHYHAMDQRDARTLATQIGRVRELVGEAEQKRPVEGEQQARRYARRSIVASRSIAAGTALDASCLTYKRPGTGISPQFWDEVLGMRAARDIPADHVLTWSDVCR
jgi:N-acetylneuraminate synthase